MKYARLAGGFLLVLLLLVLALPWFLSAEKFRPLIQSQLHSATGRPVSFGALSLSLFPPSLSAASLKVDGLATADSLNVRVRILPLLAGNVEIASLRLIRPVISYTAAPAASSAAPTLPTIGSLAIVDGVLHYTNAAGQRSEYTDIDADLSASPSALRGELSWKNATLPVDLEFDASRAGPAWNFSRLNVKSGSITAGFTGSINTEAATVDGNLAIQPTPFDGLPLKSPYKPRGTLTAQVKLSGPYSNPALSGAVQLKNLELTGGKLSHPLRAADVQLDLTPSRITAKPFALQAGPTPIQLAFQLDGYTGAAPSLDANLAARDAAIQDLLVLAQFHDYAGAGQASFQIRATGPLARLAYSGAVDLKNLEVSGGKLTQPLRAAALHLDLTPTRITATPFTLNAGPAVIQARFQLDDYAAKSRIDADFSARDAAIQDLLALARVEGVSGSGRISLQLHAAGPTANPNLSGDGSLSAASLRFAALNPELKIDSARLRFQAAGASVEDASLHIGKSNIRGSIRVQDFERPRIAISLQADQLSSTELQSWFPPAKPSAAPDTPITLAGDLAAGRLLLSDLLLTDFRSNVSMANRVLTLDRITAAAYGGRLTGSAIVDLKPEPALVTLNTHLDKIESGQLLAAATPLRNFISGPLTADANLRFAALPAAELPRSLNGDIDLKLASGRLIPFNLLGEMQALGKFLKPLQSSAAGTPFLGIQGKLALNNGAARTDNLRVELDRAAAVVSGVFGLADQSLDLRVLTTLDKHLSEEVGGTRIGGFLSAAMAGPEGELLMPSIVKGTFAKPVFSPDPAAIGKLKLQQPGEIKDTIKGVFDMFKGRKKQP
jgi:uncharacterized protein involved in outer membrane biogenesis